MDKNFCRTMRRKTLKKFKKVFNIFCRELLTFLKFLVPKMKLNTPKTSFTCLKLSFKVLNQA